MADPRLAAPHDHAVTRIAQACALALALTVSVAAPAAGASPAPATVVVRSGRLALRAWLWRPEGRGPFPAVLFNHGSWPTTSAGRPDPQLLMQAETLGPTFARHGFVFLFLFRRGAGLSAGQGSNAADLLDRERVRHGQEARNRVQVHLLETDELKDALAGLAFLRALPDVDGRRLVAVGHSFGGSLTLLLAERDRRLAAAIDFAGAAGSWTASPALRARLLQAVVATAVPIYFIHAENDYSVEPGRTLAAEMTRLGKPHRLSIYPPTGATASDGHNMVDRSVATWERDVFAFLDDYVKR